MYRYMNLFFTLLCMSYCSKNTAAEIKLLQDPRIIILNGTTTAGKSSIANELKKLLENQSLSVDLLAIDSFIMPKVAWELGTARFNPFNFSVSTTELITTSKIEELGRSSIKELCAAAKTSYNQGKIVIIDAPIYKRDMIQLYSNELTAYNVHWSLVYCPIVELINRVMNRNATSGVLDQRSLLQAINQFNNLYTSETVNSIDMLSQRDFNTLCSAVPNQHETIQQTIPVFLKALQDAICPFDFDTLKREMQRNFHFGHEARAKIGVIKPHDCIVNSAMHVPKTCAQEIMNNLLKG